MVRRNIIKKNLKQITALIELNLKLNIRFKIRLLVSFINPIITIIMPLIVMNKIFEFNPVFGSWTTNTFYVYTIIAYNLILLRKIIDLFPQQFIAEKYWKTLTALIIAPFYRFNLLIGTFISHIIKVSIPFTIFFLLCYIIYPISVITVVSVLILFFLITLIFSGIGLIVGAFAVSKENIYSILMFFINLFFWFSCIIYPFQVFPVFIQNLILLNPLFYIFDIIRNVWIEDNVIHSIIYHPRTFLVLVASVVIIPYIGVITFNKVYKKFGIVGY